MLARAVGVFGTDSPPSCEAPGDAGTGVFDRLPLGVMFSGLVGRRGATFTERRSAKAGGNGEGSGEGTM